MIYYSDVESSSLRHWDVFTSPREVELLINILVHNNPFNVQIGCRETLNQALLNAVKIIIL